MSLVLLDLNDDCLSELIKRVPIADQVRLAQTCLRFKDLIVHAWEIRFRHGALDMNALNLGHLDMPYFFGAIRNLVRSITARRSVFASDEEQLDVRKRIMYFWRIVKDCPNLKELTLRRMVRLEGRRLVRYLPRLEALDVKGCNLTHNDIIAIFRDLRVKRLNLTGVCHTAPCCAIFPFTGHEFLPLEELKLSLEDFCNPLQDVLRLRCLKTLTVSHNGPEERTTHLDTYVMSRCMEVFENRLYHFELRYGLNTTDHFTRKLCEMKALTVLKFQFVTLEGLDTVAEALTLLRELSFTDCAGVTDTDLLNFVRNCRQLAVLDVKGCKNLTEALIWESGDILLPRNDGIRLQIIVSQSSLSTDIVQKPGFYRFRSVLEITDNYKHFIRDPQALSNTLTYKFLECSDEDYELLKNKLRWEHISVN